MPLFYDDDDDDGAEENDDDEEGTQLDLDEIEDAILNGEEIQVIDQETGEAVFTINPQESDDEED